MKSIVKIIINKNLEKEIKVTKKDESGADIIALEKVIEKVPQIYLLAKPSISLQQDSILYYESVVAECIKSGIFSTIQMRKRFVDDDGILGVKEKETYSNLLASLWIKKAELNKFNEDAEKFKEEVKATSDAVAKILSDLQTIEERSGNSLMYEHTAEKIASDRTAIWWMLFLSYKDNNGKFESVFGTGKFNDRMTKYEEIIDREDKLDKNLIDRLLLAATVWAFGKADKQEEFDKIFKDSEDKRIIEPLD